MDLSASTVNGLSISIPLLLPQCIFFPWGKLWTLMTVFLWCPHMEFWFFWASNGNGGRNNVVSESHWFFTNSMSQQMTTSLVNFKWMCLMRRMFHIVFFRHIFILFEIGGEECCMTLYYIHMSKCHARITSWF